MKKECRVVFCVERGMAMFKTLGILVLITLIGHWGYAMKPDLNNPNGIAAIYSEGGGGYGTTVYLVCTNGSGLSLSMYPHTDWASFDASPVPLEEVEYWNPYMVYTFDGRFFGRHAPQNPWMPFGEGNNWTIPECFSPVDTKEQGLSELKGMFRGQADESATP